MTGGGELLSFSACMFIRALSVRGPRQRPQRLLGFQIYDVRGCVVSFCACRGMSGGRLCLLFLLLWRTLFRSWCFSPWHRRGVGYRFRC